MVQRTSSKVKDTAPKREMGVIISICMWACEERNDSVSSDIAWGAVGTQFGLIPLVSLLIRSTQYVFSYYFCFAIRDEAIRRPSKDLPHQINAMLGIQEDFSACV